jgi:small multidrug resistance pump
LHNIVNNIALIGYLWCAGAACFSALSTYLIKLSGMAGADWNLARLMWLGAAAGSYVLGFGCYSVALQKLQISLAYPVMTAVTMSLVTAIGWMVLNEPLTATKIGGLCLIGAGAFVLAR